MLPTLGCCFDDSNGKSVGACGLIATAKIEVMRRDDQIALFYIGDVPAKWRLGNTVVSGQVD